VRDFSLACRAQSWLRYDAHQSQLMAAPIHQTQSSKDEKYIAEFIGTFFLVLTVGCIADFAGGLVTAMTFKFLNPTDK